MLAAGEEAEEEEVLDLTMASSPEKGVASPSPKKAPAAASSSTVLCADEEDDFDALLTNEYEDVLGPEPSPGPDGGGSGRRRPRPRAKASVYRTNESDEDSDDSGGGGGGGPPTKPAGRKRGAAAAPKPPKHPKKSKEELAQERAEAKALRDAQKAIEKRKLAEKKAWDKLITESLRGFHKCKEICVILDKRLEAKLGEKVREELTSGETYKHLFLPGPGYDVHDEPLEASRYHHGFVGWTRMPRPMWDDEVLCPRPHGQYVEQLDFVAMVWEAEDFCNKLGMDKRANLPAVGGGGGANVNDGDPVFGHTYERLERTIQQMRQSPGVPPRARLVVVLQGVQKEIGKRWDRYNRRRSKGLEDANDICVDSDDCANALVWLLLARGIEYKETKDEAETAQYIRETTRTLSEMPFRDINLDLSSVAKGKAIVNGAEGTSVQNLSEKDRIATAWARQLEAISGMSDAKALEVIKHYPTLRSLLDVYDRRDLTEKQKENLLADKMGTANYSWTLSSRIYHVFTAADPDLPLKEGHVAPNDSRKQRRGMAASQSSQS